MARSLQRKRIFVSPIPWGLKYFVHCESFINEAGRWWCLRLSKTLERTTSHCPHTMTERTIITMTNDSFKNVMPLLFLLSMPEQWNNGEKRENPLISAVERSGVSVERSPLHSESVTQTPVLSFYFPFAKRHDNTVLRPQWPGWCPIRLSGAAPHPPECENSLWWFTRCAPSCCFIWRVGKVGRIRGMKSLVCELFNGFLGFHIEFRIVNALMLLSVGLIWNRAAI